MRKFTIAAVAVLAIAGSTAVYAQHRHWGYGHMRMNPEDRAAFADARIASVHAGLRLNADQEKLWPAVETAVREFAKLRIDRANARMDAPRDDASAPKPDDPVGRLRERADNMATSAAAMKKIADAADPLYKTLDDGQKRRLAILHAGQRPDPVTGARAVPIYQTTSYVFQDSDHAAALFNLERAGHIYTRISNPTTAVLEERLAALEAGVGAICTASGMAALHLAIATLLNAGDHIVASSSLYGGTINLLAHTLPRFGITTTFVKPRELDAFRAAIQPNTKLVIGETIGNPGLEVLDIPDVAQIAHDAKIPLLIDNTFATPFLSRPIELGADIVMNSATKWIGGHGIAIGGVIVDGGHFDWHESGKFPVLTEPYAGYHGIVFDEQFGQAAFIMRARTEGLRDFGACLSPTNAFQLLQGVETLGVRMERHMSNTLAVLEFLKANKAVEWVLHPALEDHPDHQLALRLLPKGAGSIVSFGIKGGRPAGKKFIETLRMVSHLANVGDAKTLVIHPASTTHQQMDAAQLKAAGIGEELVRLSVGIEAVSDIIDDLGQALRASQKV